MIWREHYFLVNVADLNPKEILLEFIKQYYMEKKELPNKIMLQEEIEEKVLLENILSKKAGRKVELKFPHKGEKQRFVEMAINNSKITLENKLLDKSNLLTELKETLKLNQIARKIEMYDISNISGQFMVAGMVVAQDGIIKKNLSRRFKIKTVFTQDDPRCMQEVVTRRIKHSIGEQSKGFGKLPDVIFADGGITQIRAIREALNQYKISIAIFGIVKNEKHQTRAIINENREEIEISESIMKFLTNFQNEVHNVAIEYHRKLREAEMKKSQLDEIPGIGSKKKQELLKKFGSIANIKNATIEEISKINGINKELAERIKKNLE